MKKEPKYRAKIREYINSLDNHGLYDYVLQCIQDNCYETELGIETNKAIYEEEYGRGILETRLSKSGFFGPTDYAKGT